MNERKIIKNIEVRFRDIDSMGHVNNAVYLTYFEEGRKEFLRSVFGIVNPDDYNFILAHISCDFLKPIAISERVFLEIQVGDIGEKRFDFIYKLLKHGPDDSGAVLCARGRSVQVFFDYRENTSLPIPPDVREELMKYSARESRD